MRLDLEGFSSWPEESPILVSSSPVLAAAASRHFAEMQLRTGADSWQRPLIHGLPSWLVSCWQEARYDSPELPSLLSPSQEALLWESVIESENPDLFDIPAAAELARQAAHTMAEWRIPLDSSLWSDHRDGQQFRLWFERFRDRCRREEWIARSDLFDRKWLPRIISRKEPVAFLGFDRISPALASLREHLPQAQMFATEIRPIPAGLVPVTQYADLKEELTAAARWARFRLEEEGVRSLAVFVPDLRGHLDLVERVFREICYPAWGIRLMQNTLHLQNPEDSVFHVSQARSQSERPLIASAFLLLNLALPRISHVDAAAIVRCPFLASAAEERSQRAFADLNLRRMRELDFSIRDLEFASRDCPLLARVWGSLKAVLRAKPSYAEPSAWSDFFADLLQATGWPGDAELTSAEQESVELWNKALSALGALGMVLPLLTFDAAINRLERLLRADGPHIGNWFSPIQILDASDAAGLRFDAAFLVGLSDELWPPASRTNPLLPRKLLRAHGVPSSSPEGMQAERVRYTRALFASAPILQASYHGRLSPLAEPFVNRDALPASVWMGASPIQSCRPVALDEIQDDTASPFDVTKLVRGGTSVIKAQSLCPFRAFAEVRLRAQSPDDASFGFDSRDRGGFLHKALQTVWQQLKTQSALQRMPLEALRSLVREAIRSAVQETQGSEFHSQITSVEQERLERLILDWLITVERERPKAFTVETVEDQLQYDLAGLPLRLRIDRIDRLANGRILLIDYKSGRQSRGKLNCPRPSEPQLLVYASAKGSSVDGVFFGEVKPRELRVVGYARDKYFKSQSITVKGSKWDTFAEEARDEVHALAQDFLAGKALVDPIAGACEYCGIKPFCRVNEKISAPEED